MYDGRDAEDDAEGTRSYIAKKRKSHRAFPSRLPRSLSRSPSLYRYCEDYSTGTPRDITSAEAAPALVGIQNYLQQYYSLC